MVKLFQKV